MIKYYIYKLTQTISSLSLALLLPNTKWKNWIISYIPKKFAFKNHVILGFWDTKLMHFGDHLFHLGLIRSLQESGVRVSVAGNIPLKPLFEKMKIDFINPKNLTDISGALIISKDDMFFSHLRLNKSNSFLGVNYRFTKSKSRIGEILFKEMKISLESFGKIIEMKKEFWSTENLIPESTKTFDLSENTILYNDFVASGAFTAYQRLSIILNLGRRLSSDGFNIVYVGNPNEKQQRSAPQFISRDLRGETLVSELFSLTQDPNVKAIVTYDTLWAHVGNIVGKKIYVVNKQKNNHDAIWDRFVPMSDYISGEIETY
ncbi:hypothetical protein GW765_03965 [Candidatus Parcubacteria bacterium]|nr:hypothetical protein [Candidatus Parcubacteria bacterium]